ncbi:MAG: hypothetical protein AB7H86_19235 [Blastocatellales bacterium]
MQGFKKISRMLMIALCLMIPVSGMSVYAVDENTQGATEKKSPPPNETEEKVSSGDVISPEMRMLIYLIGVLVP